MKAYKSTRDLPLSRRMKAALGRTLAAANPTLAARVREKPFTRPLKYHERLLRNARQHQAIAEKDDETLHQFLVDYWASPFSNEFFELFANRFEELFLTYHADIVPELGQRLRSNEMDQPIHLMELGCGDGKVLHYLSENLPQVSHFTGLDLSASEIANCKSRYRKMPTLQFATTEASPWLRQHPREPLVFYTNGGVLE
jgi:predicted TPR repeat methyltransferase